MNKQLNQFNSEIIDEHIIHPKHITQFSDALTGEEAYDVKISGSVELPSNTSIGNVSSIEISYINGVTSSIQNQLNNKPNVFTSSTDPSLVYTVKNGDRWIYDGTPLTGYEWINNNWFVSSGGYGSHMIPNIGEYYICGIVFYIDLENRFTMVADLDAVVEKPYGLDDMTLHGATNTGINSGELNTLATIAAYPTLDCAASYCNEHIKSGFNDWFLPTLYNSDIQEGFASILPVGNYWTSLEVAGDPDPLAKFLFKTSNGTFFINDALKNEIYNTIPVKKINI